MAFDLIQKNVFETKMLDINESNHTAKPLLVDTRDYDSESNESCESYDFSETDESSGFSSDDYDIESNSSGSSFTDSSDYEYQEEEIESVSSNEYEEEEIEIESTNSSDYEYQEEHIESIDSSSSNDSTMSDYENTVIRIPSQYSIN